MSKTNKDNFRKLCLSKLQFISKNTKITRDRAICSKIIDIIKIYKPKKVLLYIPLKTEVDVRPIINRLRKEKNIEVYVPYMKGKSFVPVKYRLPLTKKRFNIKEPNFSRYKNNNIDLDLIVVPIVGVDKTLRRVGFGAGMYDRFYDRLKRKPITIFTQLTLCKTNEIVTSEHDIKADYIITI
ncbi:MAG: 5-formyltetrahydrofolate cyclo-ligase [Campylobacterota bacterium]|nr:5-formyltetrahydrofolate cyclo-ligase [Campylobacterota bacterium]